MFKALKTTNMLKGQIEALKQERGTLKAQRNKMKEELADLEQRISNGFSALTPNVTEVKQQIDQTYSRDREIDAELDQLSHYLRAPELLEQPEEVARKLEAAVKEVEKASQDLDKALAAFPLDRYTAAFQKLYDLSSVLPSGITDARMAEMKLTSAFIHHLADRSSVLTLPARYDVGPLAQGVAPTLDRIRKYAASLKTKGGALECLKVVGGNAGAGPT